jgi:hypothetical protein
MSAAVLIAVALAGCGSSGKATSASTSSASSAVPAGCTSQRNDVPVQVTIYAGGTAACAIWNNQAARSSGPRWHLTAAKLQVAPVCSLASGPNVIEVRQAGTAESGHQLCANLKSKAWTEVEGPGERAEKAAHQH